MKHEAKEDNGNDIEENQRNKEKRKRNMRITRKKGRKLKT